MTKTASTCITTTTSTIFKPATTWTTWSFSECRTTIGCSVTDSSSSTTKTGTIGYPTPGPVLTDYAEIVPLDIPINTARLNSIDGITTVPSPTTTTTADTPPPTPTPSGSLCLVLWLNSFIDGPNDFFYGAYKPNDPCSNGNSVQVDAYKAPGVCDLGHLDGFKVCGTEAKFVNEGPVFTNIEKDSSCSLQLQIDGVNYAGTMVDPLAPPCSTVCAVGGVAFGTALGRLLFENVPICQ